MKACSIGELLSENFLLKDAPVVGTTPIVLVSPSLDNMDGLSFQIITGDFVQTGTSTVTVSETAGTATWTIPDITFVAAMVGGTITVSGMDEAGNNGTFTIAGFTSAHVITTTTSTEVDEGPTTNASVTTTVAADPIQATFTVDVSDTFVRATLPGLNQVPNAGDWGPVTSKFANTGSPFFPAIAAITADGAPYYQMYPLVGRFVRWTITPTDGTGNLSFSWSAKGNR